MPEAISNRQPARSRQAAGSGARARNSGGHRDDRSQHRYNSGRKKRDLSHQCRQHSRHALEFEGRERLRYSAGAGWPGLLHHRRQRTHLPALARQQTNPCGPDQRGRSHAAAAVERLDACGHGQYGQDLQPGRASSTPARGTYESPVFDAGSVAQWGRLRWQGENGAGKIAMRTRTGNSIRPDATWSDWSRPHAGSDGTQIKSPNARFCNIKAELTGSGAIVENVSAATCRRTIRRRCIRSPF